MVGVAAKSFGNGTAYINPNCSTSMVGTRGITGCPPEIINNVVDACLKKTVETVLNNDVTGKISEIIANLDKNLNVTVKIYDATTISGGADARNINSEWRKDDNTGAVTAFSTDIILSKDVLLSASKEFASTVLIHEVLHAYFRETSAKAEAFDELDHQTIATNYIEPMAEFISGLYGISLSDAMAISWNGVRGTKAFTDVTSFTIGSGTNATTLSKEDVLNLIRDYTIKSNGKGKELCL